MPFGSQNRSFLGAALLLAVAFLCAPVVASAQSGGEGIRITWREAAGPVVGYDVYVSINGQGLAAPSFTESTELEVSGDEFQRGDELRFRVVAVAADGRRGLPSELSDVIFFVSPPVPQALIADDGSTVSPNTILWNAVDHVDFYVVFRSEDPGSIGTLLAPADDAYVEDFEAALEVTYYYTVAAIKGRQVSEFSTAGQARRGADPPNLQLSSNSLSYSAAPGEITATQTVSMTNTGDWEFSYTAWPSRSWIQLSPPIGTVDDEVQLQLTYSLSSLAPGDHAGIVRIFTQYEPGLGESLVSGPPLDIAVAVSIPTPDSLPVIEAPASSWVTLAEGDLIEVSVVASDADPGDIVELGMTPLPAFATFETFGDGTGRITLVPDYVSAGLYRSTILAWNSGGQVAQELTILVEDRNLVPTIVLIPDTTIPAGEESTILIQAWDPDGGRLAITSSALPDFGTLTDFGNGTAEFSFDPSAGDVGTYLVVVAAVDDGIPAAVGVASFLLTVE